MSVSKKPASGSVPPVESKSAEDTFQHLLLELSWAAAQGGDSSSLVEFFCAETRKFLRVSGAYYWRLEENEGLIAVGADGHLAERFRAARLQLSEAAVATDAVRRRQTCYVNHLDSQQYAMAGEFGARALMAAPVVLFGKVTGVAVFLHNSDPDFFQPDLAAKVTILAAQLGSLLEYVRLAHTSDQHRKRADDLMTLALELGSSLRLPDLVRNFTAHAAKILGARVGALALAQGTLLEIVALHDPAGEPERGVLRSLNTQLTERVQQIADVLCIAANEFLGAGLAAQLGWQQLTLARLSSANGDLLGVLCLADGSSADQPLLHAVIGQAAVALDNCRLFSRIAQANQHWMEIFDAMEDLIVVHDEGNRVLRVNRSLAESIGAGPAELIGISMRTLVASSQGNTGQACPFCRRPAEQDQDYLHPVLGRLYLVSTSRIHGALDEGLQTIHVLKDITERREVERRYRELFDNIQEGLFFSTPEGRFVEVNDAFVRMLGYSSAEELLQADILRDVYAEPGQRERFQVALAQQGVIRNFEETLRRKDGSLVHTLQNTFAVRDSGGSIVQYRGLILDITEQKKYHAQLQRERDFNTSILNNTQNLILVADASRRVTYANRRCFELGGYRPEDVLGQALGKFVHASRREEMDAAFEATLAGNQVDNLELSMMRGDGTVGQFSVNFSPMRDEDGAVSNVVAVMADITEAVNLQSKLRHTEKMAAVGQLVSGVAHEVNNPLTAILGFADLLAENPHIPEAARDDINLIVQEAQRTKLIVQNLLSFARKMPAQREPVQLNTIIRKTLQLRAYDFASHHVHAVERLQEDLPEVVGDPNQLQQVVLNILNNAYDAVRDSGAAGHIEIITQLKNGFNEIVFRDNGPGIAYPERIFDPFFTTKEVGKGTGLGLSICYGILREHGGDVTCHNNHRGPGATFVVRLPLAPSTALAADAAMAAEGGAS